jgi:hypothetical protein
MITVVTNNITGEIKNVEVLASNNPIVVNAPLTITDEVVSDLIAVLVSGGYISNV